MKPKKEFEFDKVSEELYLTNALVTLKIDYSVEDTWFKFDFTDGKEPLTLEEFELMVKELNDVLEYVKQSTKHS